MGQLEEWTFPDIFAYWDADHRHRENKRRKQDTTHGCNGRPHKNRKEYGSLPFKRHFWFKATSAIEEGFPIAEVAISSHDTFSIVEMC